MKLYVHVCTVRLPAANTVAMMISPLLHLTSQQSSTGGTVALTRFFLRMIEIVSSTVNLPQSGLVLRQSITNFYNLYHQIVHARMLLIPYKSTLTCRCLNRLSYAFTIDHPFTSHIHVDWARMVDFHIEYLKAKTVDLGKMILSSQSDSFLCLAFRFIVRILFDSSWYPCSNWNHRFKVQGSRIRA